MELEKGKILPHGDPLDLEEGELREDAATIPTTGAPLPHVIILF